MTVDESGYSLSVDVTLLGPFIVRKEYLYLVSVHCFEAFELSLGLLNLTL